MVKKTNSLLHRFMTLFVAFTLVVLIVGGVATYLSQMNNYKLECERNIRAIGEYLALLIEFDSEEFKQYQEYYMDHYEEMNIPYYFQEYKEAYEHFLTLFTKTYPGMIFGKDIKIEELSDEVKKAYFIYKHEKWLLTFEKARESFNIPYSYYLVIDDPRCRDTGYPDHNVVYMIDGERTSRIGDDGKRYIYMGDSYYYPQDKYEIMWRTWETAQKQDGYMEYDNEWGHTYGYFTPLILNEQLLGLVVTEIDVAKVNYAILMNTLTEVLITALVLVIGVALILVAIEKYFIKRTVRLEKAMNYYSQTKDSSIALDIEREFEGKDELSSLGKQFSTMILELNNYMENLTRTTMELEDTQLHAAEMMELANKDALTGVRNKNAYDKEIQKVEWDIQSGANEFGVVVVDLNYLKRINDTYGHEKGNMAIQRLCHLVCLTFAHSPVFRIGGDEFAVIVRNDDYNMIETLAENFNSTVERVAESEELEYWERTSAALGYALFDKDTDFTFKDVFKRADANMYQRKRAMKAERKA